MIQRYRLAFFLSLLTFISLFAIYLNLPKVDKNIKTTQTKVIKIALISPIKKVVKPLIIPKKKATPAPAKIEKKRPKKPVIIKNPKPKKAKSKKVFKKKVVKKKIIKKKKVIIKKRVIKKKVISKPIENYKPIVPPIYHTAPPVYVAPKAVEEPVIKQTKVIPPQPVVNNDHHKEAFLRNVRSKIIAHKKYPKIAKRRHIEGSVKVRFDININGQVTNIRFINGKRIFQKSIKKTLAQCFPMSVPNNVKGELPIQDVSIVLHFNIR